MGAYTALHPPLPVQVKEKQVGYWVCHSPTWWNVEPAIPYFAKIASLKSSTLLNDVFLFQAKSREMTQPTDWWKRFIGISLLALKFLPDHVVHSSTRKDHPQQFWNVHPHLHNYHVEAKLPTSDITDLPSARENLRGPNNYFWLTMGCKAFSMNPWLHPRREFSWSRKVQQSSTGEYYPRGRRRVTKSTTTQPTLPPVFGLIIQAEDTTTHWYCDHHPFAWSGVDGLEHLMSCTVSLTMTTQMCYMQCKQTTHLNYPTCKTSIRLFWVAYRCVKN